MNSFDTTKGLGLDFYLSEMSVSDLHGGGLTLQRILGEDLSGIPRFIHAGRFARDVPPAPDLRSRSEFVVSVLEEHLTQRFIGCRPSHWLLTRRPVRMRQIRQIAWRLQNLSPDKQVLAGLVCPQAQVVIHALEFLKSVRKVKYISWMMDDHVVSYTSGRWVYPPVFHQVFRKHLREADSVFVISPIMAELYQREFGVRSTVLFGPGGDLPGEAREVPSNDGTLRIGYFGRIWSWQLEGLCCFAAALDPGRDRLDIYTPESELPLALRLPSVTAKGFLPQQEVRKRMLDYDAVLLPLSFSDAHRSLVELNIATKMSEYLASGTVTIAFGPSYAAMVRFLDPPGAACVVTDASLKQWPSIRNRLLDVIYRRQLLNAAKTLVQAELSTAVMRRKWRVALEKLNREKILATV